MKVIITWVIGICILLASIIVVLDITFSTGLTYGGIRILSHALLGGVAHAVQSLPHALSSRMSPLILVSLLMAFGAWIATALPAASPILPWRELARGVAKVLGGIGLLILGAAAWANVTSNSVALIKDDAIASPERTWTGVAISKARTLTTALHIYASENGGNYPRNLGELAEAGVLDRKAFTSLNAAFESDGLPVPWIYFHGLHESSPGNFLLLASPMPRGGKRIVALNEGSVTLALPQEYDDMVKQWREIADKAK